MTTTQLYFAIGLPTLAVLASLTVNLFAVFDIKGDIREIRSEIREMRSDLKLMVGKLADLDTRISVIEENIK